MLQQVRVCVIDPARDRGGPTTCMRHEAAPGAMVAGEPYVFGRIEMLDDRGNRVCPACVLPAIHRGSTLLADPEAVRALLAGAGHAERGLVEALLAADADAGHEEFDRLRAAVRYAVRRGGTELADLSALLREGMGIGEDRCGSSEGALMCLSQCSSVPLSVPLSSITATETDPKGRWRRRR
jgi:hypothetical protein